MPQAHRQQLGLACEDCRRRKARCDRSRPSCGSCQDAGAACCYIDKRPQRGPRKGQMDALKNLVANLEQRLGEQMGQQQPNHGAVPSDAVQKHNAVPEATTTLEHDIALADAVPMTLSIDLENNNVGNTAFGSTSHESTPLSSKRLETAPFGSSSLVSTDMKSSERLDESQSTVIIDQNPNSDWLNGNSNLSPSATTLPNINNDWLDNNSTLSPSSARSQTSNDDWIYSNSVLSPLDTTSPNANNDWLDNNLALSPSSTRPRTSNSDWLHGNLILPPSVTTPGTQQLVVPEHMQSLDNPTLSDLMQIDLDELYFDRVHPVAPNIYRRNYFTWASQKCLSVAQIALQYAMRAVAAAVSAQYRPLSGPLCAESRRVLEQMDGNGAGDYSDTPIEQIQAWLLVAHCELLCKHEQQAMVTAGRAIRMVQLARLHDVDAYNVSSISLGAEMPLFSPSPLSDDDSFTKAEEKRRTFWLAYCFDRFCLMRDECPPSLQEESVSGNPYPSCPDEVVRKSAERPVLKSLALQIRTRLPAPEANFQNNQPIRMEFLPEALALSGRTVLPPFAECVVLNSLFSRCMSHQRLILAAPISRGNDSQKFWSKQAWLALPVEKRKQLLVQRLPNATDCVDDPMLTYVHALAACAAMYVYQSMAYFMDWPTVDQEVAVPTYEEQAVQAASELAHFVKMMPRSISHFKAHPFLPILIHRAAVSLIEFPRSPNPTETGYNNRDDDLKTLIEALRNLQQINNLSRGSLCKIEKDAFGIT